VHPVKKQAVKKFSISTTSAALPAHRKQPLRTHPFFFPENRHFTNRPSDIRIRNLPVHCLFSEKEYPLSGFRETGGKFINTDSSTT